MIDLEITFWPLRSALDEEQMEQAFMWNLLELAGAEAETTPPVECTQQ